MKWYERTSKEAAILTFVCALTGLGIGMFILYGTELMGIGSTLGILTAGCMSAFVSLGEW